MLTPCFLIAVCRDIKELCNYSGMLKPKFAGGDVTFVIINNINSFTFDT